MLPIVVLDGLLERSVAGLFANGRSWNALFGWAGQLDHDDYMSLVGPQNNVWAFVCGVDVGREGHSSLVEVDQEFPII